MSILTAKNTFCFFIFSDTFAKNDDKKKIRDISETAIRDLDKAKSWTFHLRCKKKKSPFWHKI